MNCCLHFCCIILYKFTESCLILFAELVFMLWCQIHCLAEQLFIFFLVIIWLLYVFANENCLLTRSITIITMFQMFNSVKPWEWFWCVYSSSTHLKALDLGYIFSFTFYHYWPCLPLPFLIRLNFCCCYISYLDHCSYNSSYNLFFPSVFSKMFQDHKVSIWLSH